MYIGGQVSPAPESILQTTAGDISGSGAIVASSSWSFA